MTAVNPRKMLNVEMLDMRIRNCISIFIRGCTPADTTPHELSVGLLMDFAAAAVAEPPRQFGGTSARRLKAFFAVNGIPWPEATRPDAAAQR